MIKKKIVGFIIFSCVAVLFTGCTTTKPAEGTQEGKGNQLTVGTVQREIRKGMSGSEVIESIGSPNIVSTDEQGREVWVYDKISTDRVESDSSSYGTLILFGFGEHSNSSSTSQQTLTIIIKFDEEKKVRDFAYHSSRF
jgi:outer membrane protein assembly factor BamE (lipoprotein component of BamABCDE complex)